MSEVPRAGTGRDHRGKVRFVAWKSTNVGWPKTWTLRAIVCGNSCCGVYDDDDHHHHHHRRRHHHDHDDHDPDDDDDICYERYHCHQLSPMAFALWASSRSAASRQYHCSAGNLLHYYIPAIFKPSQRLSLRQLSRKPRSACCMSEVPRAQTGRDHKGVCKGALHRFEKY